MIQICSKEKNLININDIANIVYVVMGIDENEHDQVICVFKTFEKAKDFLIKGLVTTGFLDIWVEKHDLK